MTEKEPQQEVESEPVEVTAENVSTGGRVRRTIQKFGFSEPKDEEEEEFKPPVGPGTKLSDMEAVAERIAHMGKKDAETIKSLYNIMYGRRFQQKNIRTIKEHILEFSGVPDADDKVRQQLAAKMGRWMRSYVQDIMDVLGVDRSKKSFDEENKPFDKDSLINRLVEWLCNPQESATARKKSASSAKKKSPSSKTAAKKPVKASTAAATGTKRKSATAAKKGPAKKAKKAAAKAAEEEDATESEVENDQEEEEDDADDSDFDEEDSKKKKKKTATKKAGKRATKKSAKHVDEDNDESMENEAAEEAEEPKKSELTDDVQAKVKDIIAKGDAQQLTVKKIVRQLSEDLGEDFSSKKAAIKDFVTNLQM